MPRRVFFSFHYQRDIWRVNQVRKAWQFPGKEEVGFWDGSLWEKTKLRGDAAIKALINSGLRGTSVTIVLIGTETASRRYVNYEIEQSHALGKGLLGIHIYKLEDEQGRKYPQGLNPLSNHRDKTTGRHLSDIYPTYYWYGNDGRANIGRWIEDAARRAGRL